MQPGRLQVHAESFSHGADGYDRHRPSYPMASVEWLRGASSAPLEVLDLGAGTGKLSELLLARGDSVTAVDPSADMLRVAGERMPQLRTLVGSGEKIPLADSSVDLVTVAQAWHWMNEEVTTREVLRVLRPAGRLGLIWNRRDDSVPWVSEFTRALHNDAIEMEFVPKLGAGMNIDGTHVERWVQRTSREGLLQLATTRSYYMVASKQEQRATLARIESVLDSHPETRVEEILLPYITESWLASAWTGESA